MEPIKLQTKILVIWRMLLVVAAAVPAFLLSLFLEPFAWIWNLSIGLLAIVFLFFFVFYIPRYYQNYSIQVREDCLCVTNGVFAYSTRVVPTGGIQYVSLLATPFDRIFGLVTLRVVMAGGSLLVPGIRPMDAKKLFECLSLSVPAAMVEEGGDFRERRN